MRKPSTRWIYGDPEFRTWLRGQGLENLAALSAPSLGEFVTGHRSSWVRRLPHGATAYYIKTYDYSTWKSRCRGVGRNTFLRASRPRRERRALNWLAEHGFAAPRVLAEVESRTLRAAAGGFLTRAVLVTEAWPGDPLSTLLPELATAARQSSVLVALEEFVAELHAAGFRDGNLDLRNILARHEGSTWRFAKIDSPRFVVVRRGTRVDARAIDDWRRLGRDLSELGLSLPASATGRSS
jgi:Lipopolysaccharide kinase (Kdo/WaaP) family